MSLSSEDALRLNVLLANKPQAIRIDESSMTLFGLSDKGEAKIKLNPNCRDDFYLRKVCEVLSGHVQGSPLVAIPSISNAGAEWGRLAMRISSNFYC